jgi:transcriptional regulator CtsR
MKRKVLLIDYENIQQIDLSVIEDMDIQVKIFIGKSQNKIPFSLVAEAQRFGTNFDWIKIDGNGNNALDFHIAYYLGFLTRVDQKSEYIILSKDKGFDPVVRYVTKKKISCKRINSIVEILESQKKPSINQAHMDKVLENLRKIDKAKRPRKRATLHKHVVSLVKGTMSEKEITEIIDELFIEGLITEENNRIKYEME